MKKFILYVILICFVALTAVTFHRFIKSVNERQSLYKEEISNFQNYKDLNQESVSQQVLNNNFKIDREMIVIGLQNDKYSLKSLFTSGIKLVVRNSETGCGLCIEKELEIIKKYSNLIGNENIIMLTSHNSVRKLEVFKKTNKFDFKIFSCQKLDIPYERVKEKPYIFLMDADLTVKDFFIPELTEPQLSDAYYSTVGKKYFDKSKI